MNYIEELNAMNNEPITDEQYCEINKFSNCDIDIAEVKFRESTTERICDFFDLDNFMKSAD